MLLIISPVCGVSRGLEVGSTLEVKSVDTVTFRENQSNNIK